MKKLIFALLIVSTFSCSKTAPCEDSEISSKIIYVTAEAVDYDGAVTLFPVAVVRTN